MQSENVAEQFIVSLSSCGWTPVSQDLENWKDLGGCPFRNSIENLKDGCGLNDPSNQSGVGHTLL